METQEINNEANETYYYANGCWVLFYVNPIWNSQMICHLETENDARIMARVLNNLNEEY